MCPSTLRSMDAGPSACEGRSARDAAMPLYRSISDHRKIESISEAYEAAKVLPIRDGCLRVRTARCALSAQFTPRAVPVVSSPSPGILGRRGASADARGLALRPATRLGPRGDGGASARSRLPLRSEGGGERAFRARVARTAPGATPRCAGWLPRPSPPPLGSFASFLAPPD